MPFNNSAMVDAANGVRTAITHAQLHSAAAGGAGTSNVTSAARVAIPWAAATGLGNFGLSAQLNFTGGAPGGTVYSVTFWTAITGGTFKGEEPLTGDLVFNAAGSYSVTVIDATGTAT